MEHIKDLDLICLMLLDIFPDLQIRGVDYMANAANLLAGTQYEYLVEDLDKSLLQISDGERKDNESNPKEISFS